jgi:hypothetical protein
MMKKVCKLNFLKKFAFWGKYTLSAIVFSLLTPSCNEVGNEIPENFTGEEQEVVFSMNVPMISESTSKLRSIGEAQENAIQTVDLLAFSKDNSLFNYHYKGVLIGNTGTPTQECRVKVRLAKYKQDLVIITNAGTLVDAVVKSNNGQTISKEDFLAQLEYTLSETSPQWNTSSPSNYNALPMWGETSATITPNIELSVSLLRMLAKIDVQLDEEKGVSNIFKLKSVRLYNTNIKGRIVPNSAVVQNMSVTAPSLPNAPGKYLGPLVYDKEQDFTIPNVAMKGAIYTFETQAPQDDPLEATCLVVGGEYGNNAESYYRVDFLEDGNFQDILRNHRYLVNIVSVTGPGYKNPDEAFRNKSVNMDVNILVWDTNNMYDVIFDGQFYLSVSRDSILVSREEQDNTELFVITDYNPDNPLKNIKTGWYVDSIIDIATGNTCTWLTVDPTTREGKPNELKNVKLKIKQNDDIQNNHRSAKITFAAGRLRYPVKIYQSLLEKATITIFFKGNVNKYDPEEIIFPITLGQKSLPIEFWVDWTPKEADFVIYQTTVPGISSSIFDVSPDITGITTGGNNGARLEAAITPRATVKPSDIENEPLPYQRATKMVFSVSNGLNTVEKSVILKHVYSGNQ